LSTRASSMGLLAGASCRRSPKSAATDLVAPNTN
jgi:hypothetical protein